MDGYVFWCRSDILSPSALFNACAYNQSRFGQSTEIATAAPFLNILGSLHISGEIDQDEDHTAVVNSMIFTSESPINDFDAIGPNEMYVADYQGIQFAFRQRSKFYVQSGLSHYRGNALYSIMDTQLVDSIGGFDAQNVIVSNSLPLWLSLLSYQGLGTALNPFLTLFPSFLAPQNEVPPYGTVHIEPSETRAIQPVPVLGGQYQHYQLAHDTVKITIYGTRNFNALDFVDAVNQYSMDTGAIGIMNIPVVRDDKRTQAEMRIIAQKKVIDVEVSYLQNTMRTIGTKLIRSAMPSLYINSVKPGEPGPQPIIPPFNAP